MATVTASEKMAHTAAAIPVRHNSLTVVARKADPSRKLEGRWRHPVMVEAVADAAKQEAGAMCPGLSSLVITDH